MSKSIDIIDIFTWIFVWTIFETVLTMAKVPSKGKLIICTMGILFIIYLSKVYKRDFIASNECCPCNP